MRHTIPLVKYSSDEGIVPPLLSHYPPLQAYLNHGDFEVRTLPKTPVLPEVTHAHASNLSKAKSALDPSSEAPSTRREREGKKNVSVDTPPTGPSPLEYILSANILLVQSLILIPLMLPTGLSFARRSVQILLTGLAVHSTMKLLFASPNMTLSVLAPFYHFAASDSIRSSSSFVPALLSRLAIAALGGAVTRAAMAHALNALVIGHTIYRLACGREPDAMIMLASMDARIQPIKPMLLDLTTVGFMVPTGLAAQRWACAILHLPAPIPDTTAWDIVTIAFAGMAALHGAGLAFRGGYKQSTGLSAKPNRS
ncbi:uncharacterized protein PHACADRAFT_256437, partial [Phanerochaete carnosa HHB-10118-sp]